MEQKTFEEAIKRLEEIVSLLENGESNLDESLKIFQEGVALVSFCNKKLEEADQSIKILTKEGAEMKEKDFQVQNDD